ncbi:MAG: DUF4252 domain-containing protein [Bacteroidales bacterium]|nr:DUF4252 domain-containing protein [Bacteroidales bacterium]
MKKISLILTLAIFPLLITAQNKAVDKLFDKYAGKDGFTTVFISKNLFKMVADIELEDPEVNDVIDNLETIKILVTDDYENREGVNFYDEIMKELPMNEYEELLTVKDSDQDVRFLVKEKDGIIKELLLVVGGRDDNALISITGDIDLRHISKISKSMHGCGLEHLEKLEEDEK